VQRLAESSGPAVSARPSAEIDAGWGLPDDEAAEPARSEAAPAAEPQRTPTPAPPPEPLDPDGDHVFLTLVEEAIPPGTLTNVAGVKFRDAGTIHEYDAGDATYTRGQRVVVESDRGPVVATIAVGSRRLPALDPLRRILRVATSADDKSREKNVEREREAYLFCKQRIRDRNMPMKLTRVEYPLGGSGGGGAKVLFYFASEERIDFRDLVKDLAARLHARIEMRQIGARDEAKMVGGIGSCGRELCCSTWLPAFVPISIKMAKDQGLPLNPSKVSGQCGRLKCCLVYEQDTYKEMRKTLPKVGKRVNTPAGDGKVVELDVLRQKVRVWFDEGGSETFPADVVRLLAPPGQGGRPPEPEPPESEPDAE
jgi:cell fate regulator YaaT (PSP1 superfamily)